MRGSGFRGDRCSLGVSLVCADRGDHVGDFSTAGGDLIGWADYLYPNSLAVDDECGHRSGGPRSVKADLDAAQTPGGADRLARTGDRKHGTARSEAQTSELQSPM